MTPDRLDPKEVIKQTEKQAKTYRRRDFLKQVTGALATGALVGTGAYYAAKGATRDLAVELERLILDVQEAYGAVDRQIADATIKFTRRYAELPRKDYVTLGLITDEELAQLERSVRELTELQQDHNVTERLHELKDRLTLRATSIDSALEKVQPGVVKRINDGIRSLFGQPTGNAGDQYRAQLRQKLSDLCAIYESMGDTRRAEAAVLEKLNDQLDNAPKLSEGERELYSLLSQQRGTDLARALKAAKSDPERAVLALRLSKFLDEGRDYCGRLSSHRVAIGQLNQHLSNGKNIRDVLRANGDADIDVYRKSVRQTIDGLKLDGYDITTRDDVLDEARSKHWLLKYVLPYLPHISGAIGCWAAWKVYSFLRNKYHPLKASVRAKDETIGKLVNDYNALADENVELRGKLINREREGASDASS